MGGKELGPPPYTPPPRQEGCRSWALSFRAGEAGPPRAMMKVGPLWILGAHSGEGEQSREQEIPQAQVDAVLR